jgi:hypothetical protein
MYVAQLLQTISSLTSLHTDSSVVGKPFAEEWHIAEIRNNNNNNNHSGHLKQNFERFSIDWCGCGVPSTTHLFSLSFLKCKVLLCSPCIVTHLTLLFIDRRQKSNKDLYSDSYDPSQEGPRSMELVETGYKINTIDTMTAGIYNYFYSHTVDSYLI